MLMGSSDLLCDGVGERHLGGLKAHRHGYSLREPMAVPLMARRETHLPARVGEGCIQHLLGKGVEGPPTAECTMRMSTPQPRDRVLRLHMQVLLPTDPTPPRCHPPAADGCPHTHPAAHTPLVPSQCPAKEAGLVSLPTSYPWTPWVLSLGCRRRYASSNSFPIVSPEP